MWKNVVELGGPQTTVWHMCFACWIPKAANTVIMCIIAFPLQQWLQEHAPMLHHTYVARLVKCCGCNFKVNDVYETVCPFYFHMSGDTVFYFSLK